MDWFRVNTGKIRQLALVPPDAMSGWIRLLAACATAENLGRLAAKQDWGREQWAMVHGIRDTDVAAAVREGLAQWDGDALIVSDYDIAGQRLVELRRNSGTMGGRPKKPTNTDTKNLMVNSEVNLLDQQPENHVTLRNGTNGTNKHTPPRPPADAGFDAFWSAYPRRTGKAAARKAWAKLRPPLDACLKALAWQTRSEQWTRDNGQYVPHPATWLNQGRWDDERPTTPPPVDAAGQAYLRKFREGRK